MPRRRDVTDIEILLLIERVDKMSQATDDLTIAVQNLATIVTAAVSELDRLANAASTAAAMASTAANDAPVLTDLATQITAQSAALTAALATAQTSVPVTV